MSTNTDHTQKPVCPYCGHIEEDDDYPRNAPYIRTLIYCQECHKRYQCIKEVAITYSTKQMREKQ